MFDYKNRAWSGDAKNVKDLLRRMEELYREGNKEMKPTFDCYRAYIDTCAKTVTEEKKGTESAERAEAMLGKVEKIYLNSDEFDKTHNCVVYNATMNAWAQTETSESVYNRAKVILQRMYDVHTIKKNDNILPNVISFTTLMKALIKDRHPGFATKCASILSDMEQDYAKNGNNRIKPNLIAYSTVIHAFSQAKQPKMAELIIRRMEAVTASGQNHVPPNTVCYNTLMMAYVKNGDRVDDEVLDKDSFDKVEEIFQKMQTMEDCQPNKFTYTIYINALAFSDLSDKVEKAEDAFSKLEQVSSMKKDPSPQVSIKTFLALLLVYRRSDVVDKADRALQVMYRVFFGRIPNIECYNFLLEVCCHTDNSNDKARERAKEIFFQVLQTIQSPDNHLKANHYTYRLFMSSCGRLITDLKEREKTLTTLFENCCNDGFLYQKVLDSLYHEHLRHNHDLFHDLVGKPRGSGLVHMKDLPLKWHRRKRH